MPAPKTVLRDIADLDLDPELAHKKTDKSGRLKASTESAPAAAPVVVEAPKEELKYGLKVPKEEVLAQLPKVEEPVVPAVPVVVEAADEELSDEDLEEVDTVDESADKSENASGPKKKSKKK